MRLFLVLLLIGIFSSCEDKTQDNPFDEIGDTLNLGDTLKIYDYIIAGDTLFNVNYSYTKPYIGIYAGGSSYYEWDSIDVNADGVYDFKFYIAGSSDAFFGYGFGSSILPINNRNEIAYSLDNSYPAVLISGDTISNSLNWKYKKTGLLTSVNETDVSEGNWTNQENKFLAVKLVSDDTLFCWIQMDVIQFERLGISDYAYILHD